MTHTAEVSSHRASIVEPAELTKGGMVVSTRRRIQHPLERMRVRGFISLRAAAAGERLYAAWALGVCGAHDAEQSGGCSAWSPTGYRDAQLAALRDFREAKAAIAPGLWDLLVAVCCHERSVRDMIPPGPNGKASGRKVCAMMDLLREALFRLAEWYEIPEYPE